MSNTLSNDTVLQLTENGWVFNRECKCKVNKKYYYRKEDKPGIEVELHVKKHQFKVTNRGMTTRALTPMAYLVATLKGL